MYELSTVDFRRVRPLFRPLEFQLFCASVFEGRTPGRVFVDDRTNPQAAFMVTRDSWGFLAGNPDNEPFNHALNRAILSREAVGENAWVLFLICHPTGWHERLAVICAPREPIEMPRRHYVGRKLDYDWRANVPQGFTVQRIDRSLLDYPGMDIPEDVKKLASVDDPMQEGFGFVALHDGQIAASAMIDCICADEGDIGLYTADAYRWRGLATVTSAATVEYGLAHGLSRVSWDCHEYNVGSIRTAEKLGFERERDHTMYVCGFDEMVHLINMAWFSLDAGNYPKAVATCERMLALQGDPTPDACFTAACAWAGLGDRDKAIEYLNLAADRGWADVRQTESQAELRTLFDMPGWEAVMERIRQNGERQGT